MHVYRILVICLSSPPLHPACNVAGKKEKGKKRGGKKKRRGKKEEGEKNSLLLVGSSWSQTSLLLVDLQKLSATGRMFVDDTDHQDPRGGEMRQMT